MERGGVGWVGEEGGGVCGLGSGAMAVFAVYADFLSRQGKSR